MTSPNEPRQTWFFAGVLLTCMCGLMLQIMETRILSVIGYYYLAFFAIGIAMLGMTAGALAVFYRAKLAYAPEDLFELMSKIMAAFGWSVLASLIALLSIAVGARLQPTLTFVVNWAVVLLVLLPPYFLLGAAVSLALTRSVQRVNIVYGVDLIGASVGCLVTLVPDPHRHLYRRPGGGRPRRCGGPCLPDGHGFGRRPDAPLRRDRSFSAPRSASRPSYPAVS